MRVSDRRRASGDVPHRLAKTEGVSVWGRRARVTLRVLRRCSVAGRSNEEKGKRLGLTH